MCSSVQGAILLGNTEKNHMPTPNVPIEEPIHSGRDFFRRQFSDTCSWEQIIRILEDDALEESVCWRREPGKNMLPSPKTASFHNGYAKGA
jgi:hypothetical protein